MGVGMRADCTVAPSIDGKILRCQRGADVGDRMLQIVVNNVVGIGGTLGGTPAAAYSRRMMQSGDIVDLGGQVLLAMPALGDPRFHHAVIAIVMHDADGALGIVINDVADFAVSEVVAGEEFGDVTLLGRDALIGGPVQQDRGFVLHSNDWSGGDTMRASESFGMSTSIEVLREIAQKTGPRHWWLAMGYAGWGPGQLDAEIAENAWHVTQIDSRTLFEAPRETLWVDIMHADGLDPARIVPNGGTA